MTLLKLCSCGKPIDIKKTKCNNCSKSNGERHRLYDKYRRDKEAASFYSSSAWQKVREQALIRDKGLCQLCLKKKKITLADMVDHIIPIKVMWEYRFDLENLQSLCNHCHSIKTNEDKKIY
ncbi:HNH endonuclease [Metabacillus sp. 22489]|uniref:HNH endonuclease n=1 Tax=Metabacillus sp. 22489 TaxID=3453928 RepID=UPI003F84A6EC